MHAPSTVRHSVAVTDPTSDPLVLRVLAGDVVFTVSYLPHEKFTVDENGIDLIYIERIKLVDALLGFSYVQPILPYIMERHYPAPPYSAPR
jgi:hypothetical protein